MRPKLDLLGSAVGFAVLLWLLYLSVKVAQHVNAWPF